MARPCRDTVRVRQHATATSGTAFLVGLQLAKAKPTALVLPTDKSNKHLHTVPCHIHFERGKVRRLEGKRPKGSKIESKACHRSAHSRARHSAFLLTVILAVFGTLLTRVWISRSTSLVKSRGRSPGSGRVLISSFLSPVQFVVVFWFSSSFPNSSVPLIPQSPVRHLSLPIQWISLM